MKIYEKKHDFEPRRITKKFLRLLRRMGLVK